MSSLALLFFCIQACLVQSIYSACIGAGACGNQGVAYDSSCGVNSLSSANAVSIGSIGAGLGAIGAIESGAYGGSGTGVVEVVGQLPVAGTTSMSGQVPVIGYVLFEGALPACGSVSVAGNCGCGCGNVY